MQINEIEFQIKMQFKFDYANYAMQSLGHGIDPGENHSCQLDSNFNENIILMRTKITFNPI